MSASWTFALKMVDLRAMRCGAKGGSVADRARSRRAAASDHRRRIDRCLGCARREARHAPRLEPRAAADAEPGARLQRGELAARHLDVDVAAVVDATELDARLRAD